MLRFTEKGNLEVLLFTIQSKMRANNQKVYMPREGKLISDINKVRPSAGPVEQRLRGYLRWRACWRFGESVRFLSDRRGFCLFNLFLVCQRQLTQTFLNWGMENTKPYVMYLESLEVGAGSSVSEAIK